MWNIGAYHRGLMAGRTPNLDKVAAEGMLFTDYHAEASYFDWFKYEFWRFVFVR